MASTRTLTELQMLQALPLEVKVRKTQERLREWVEHYGEDGVYISFSGGKDSTVLLTIARQMYPNIKATFFDTGLEFPEIRQFVKSFDNVDWIKPKMTFKQVIEKYGYPFISKEVSECVYGARKYLTSIENELCSDRQTDRQTESASIRTTTINSADSRSLKKLSGGGAANGSGENSVESPSSIRTSMEQAARIHRAVLIADERQMGGGGNRRNFANLTGIRTTDGSTDARLWKGYNRPSSAQAAHGHRREQKTDKRQDGDYP